MQVTCAESSHALRRCANGSGFSLLPVAMAIACSRMRSLPEAMLASC